MPSTPRHVAMSWARRLKRVFGVEIESCARCSGQLKIIASIEEPQLIAKILSHLERAGRRTGSACPGEILLGHVRRVTRDFALMCSQIEDLRGLRRGHVRLAVIEAAGGVIGSW